MVLLFFCGACSINFFYISIGSKESHEILTVNLLIKYKENSFIWKYSPLNCDSSYWSGMYSNPQNIASEYTTTMPP